MAVRVSHWQLSSQSGSLPLVCSVARSLMSCAWAGPGPK